MNVKNVFGYVGLFFLLGAPILTALALSLVTGSTYYLSTSTASHSIYGMAVMSDFMIYGVIFEGLWLIPMLYVVLGKFVPDSCKERC